jgi:hypothetical protein
MPIQAYLDDSGDKGQGRIVVFGGLISESEQWQQFEKAWTACLADPPAIRYFKFSEAAGFKDCFHGFSFQQRRRKVSALASLIAEHAVSGIYCAVDLLAFQETFANADRPFSHPKFSAYERVLFSLCLEIYERGYTSEPFEAICDELPTHELKLKALYPHLRTLARFALQPEFVILPEKLCFTTDNDVMALQAADMMAGAWRTLGNDLLTHGRPQAQPLVDHIYCELGGFPISNVSSFLGAERLAIVWAAHKRLEARVAAEQPGADPEKLLAMMEEELIAVLKEEVR